MIERAVDAGLRGIQSAQESANRNAERVANFGHDENDLVTPILGLKLDTLQAKASASVLKSDEERQRSLLDILA